MDGVELHKNKSLLWYTLKDTDKARFVLSGLDIKDEIHIKSLTAALLKTKPKSLTIGAVLLSTARHYNDAYTSSLIINTNNEAFNSQNLIDQFLPILANNQSTFIRKNVNADVDVERSIRKAIRYLDGLSGGRIQ